MKIKWKIFLPLWLILILLAPSIIFPQIFAMTMSSPDAPGLPLAMPFGVIYWADNWWFLLGRGKILSFFLTCFVFTLLPIMIYTFPITLGIHHLLIRLVKRRDPVTGSQE